MRTRGSGRLRSAAMLAGVVILAAFAGIGGGAPSMPRLSLAPVTLVLQPDTAGGVDTFVLAGTPESNYGTNASLRVGPTASSGVARSLLRFDMSAVPAGSTVLDASLELYASNSTPGSVDVRRALIPWTEGDGGRPWSRLSIVVSETAGVARVNEPVGVRLSFAAGAIGDPAQDLRVWSAGTEVPSQVYDYAIANGSVAAATVYFPVSIGPLTTRTFDVTYGANGTAVPAYRTRTWGPTPLWSYGGTSTSGASVVDLDADGRLEVVFGTLDGFLHVLNETGGLEWSVQLSTGRSVPFTPQVVDMDGDGVLDILVFTNDPALHRLNRTGGVVWTRPYSVNDIPYGTPTLADVNADGVKDVLIGGRFNYVEAINGVDGQPIRQYPTGDWTYSATAYDVDADGVPELFFASDDFLVYAYRANGTLLWANSPPSTSFIETPIAIGDVDGDGVPEVVAGDDQTNGIEFALRITDGAVVWSQPLASYREGGQTLADLDRDGRLEVLVGIFTGPVHDLWGSNGTVRWTLPGASQAMAPAVADLDKDGRLDLVVLDKDANVRVVDADGAVLQQWATLANDPGLRTLSQKPQAAAAIVDLDGDGTLEVLVPTGAGLQAFATGGLSRDWRTWGYSWNHTHRAGDGTSPDGAPFLVATVGPTQSFPPSGASWRYRDGVSSWIALGGDFGSPEASATAGNGWVAWNVTGLVADWQQGTFPNVGMFLVEQDEALGGEHAFASSDASDPATRPTLTVTYLPPDPSPQIVGPVPNVTLAEDSAPFAFNLAAFARDPDTPANALRWNVSGFDPAIVDVAGRNTPGNHILTIVPRPDAFGSMAVTYWLSDPEGNFAAALAWVNVTPVNDRPVFDPPATLFVHYDEPYTFDYAPYVSDVETPRALITLSTDDLTRAVAAGLNVTYTYPVSFLNQWAFVALTVSDGVAFVAKIVAVKVTADHPPRVVVPLPDVTLFEGQTVADVFDLDGYFADPENNTLFYSFGYTHLNITIRANHSVDVEAVAEWSGQELVTFRGTDPTGALAEDTIIVTVLPTDDPPALGPVPDLRVHYDAPYTFNLEPYVSDLDTPIDGIAVSVSSAYATVSGRLVTFLYPILLNGTTEAVGITISDGTSSDAGTVNVTVTADWPPQLKAKMPDARFLEDGALPGAYDLAQFFEDPDSSALFFSSGERNVTVGIAGPNVDLSAAPDWFGVERITFRATDPDGGLAEDIVTVTVTPVNDAPYFLPIARLDTTVAAFFFDLAGFVRDVDNDAADLTLIATSPDARIVGRGVLFNFSADGEYLVDVFVNDGVATNQTVITVHLVRSITIEERIPAYWWWFVGLAAGLGIVGFVLYRRRQIEWALLINRGGILISSVSRREAAVLDTDLLSGMLTAIMDFAKMSFTDENENARELEGLELGDRQVALVRGDSCYLAVVYRGRAPGSLLRIMRSLIDAVQARYGDRIFDVIDSSGLGEMPEMLNRLVHKGWWPFLSFDAAEKP